MNKLFKSLIKKRKKKESFLKHWFAQLHLWLGLLVGIIFLIVSLTGLVYIFQEEIIKIANSDLVYNDGSHSEEASLDFIIYEFEENKGLLPSKVIIPKSTDENFILEIGGKGKERQIYFADRETGKIVGKASSSSLAFFEWILHLHRWLLVRGVGKTITGISVCVVTFMLISGIVLWFPMKKKKVKQSFTFKKNAKLSRFNYDLHNVLGFYASLFLLIIAITGLCISYHSVRDLVVGMFKSESSVMLSDVEMEEIQDQYTSFFIDAYNRSLEESSKSDFSYTKLISETNTKLTYPSHTRITFPNKRNSAFVIAKINTDNWLGAEFEDRVYFNETGAFIGLQEFKVKSLSSQINALILPLHTGEILGLKSKVIYFLITLIGCSLPITGFFIWWNKTKKKLRTNS